MHAEPNRAFGLERPHRDAEDGSVLDLLAAVEDEQRYHTAAALLARHPALRTHHESMARKDAALIADIRRDLASATRRRPSRAGRRDRFDRYLRRLMDIYLDDGEAAAKAWTPPPSRPRS